MKILEDSELNYSFEDIIEAVKDELGFSLVRTSETRGYFIVGSQVKLFIEVADNSNIELKLKFPSDEINMITNSSRAEIYSSAIESSTQIADIINRMTGEGESEDID